MSKKLYFIWKVEKAFSGKSLLFFLENQIQNLPSKRLIKKALEQNVCQVNGKIERFSSRKLKMGDEVRLDQSWLDLLEKDSSIPVAYEDEYILIINKPSGLESTPKNFKDRGLYLCHRLDKQTSGLLVLAKSSKMADKVAQLFKDRKVSKSYLALVDRGVRKEEDTIESLLYKKKSYTGQSIYASGFSGKQAITHWKCLVKNKDMSLLLVQPVTGRTHQIRVHLKEMGHPILGDRQYSKVFTFKLPVNRVLLHSYKVSFIHPETGQEIDVMTKIPKDFIDVAEMGDLCLEEF